MSNKAVDAGPFLEVPAMVSTEANDRFVPDERHLRITDEKRGASVSVGTPVVDVIVPAVIATVAAMAMARRHVVAAWIKSSITTDPTSWSEHVT
jgi:hypothetical protein